MRLIVIGQGGHGKSLLIEAIKNVREIELVEMNTNELVEMNKGFIEDIDNILMEFNDIKEFGNTTYKKKGKKVRDWERTKFYQR